MRATATHRKLVITVASLVVLGCVLAAVAIAETGPAAPATPKIDPTIASQLSVFDRDAPRVDLPDAALEYLKEEAAEGIATDPELARRVQTAVGDFYLVPGHGDICRIGAAAMACGSSAYLSTHPLSYVLFGKSEQVPDGMVIVSGIAADNVKSVTAAQPDGRRIDVPITGNVFATLVPTATARIEMDTSDLGELTTELPDVVRG